MSLLSLIACEYQRLEDVRGLRADDAELVDRLRSASGSLPSKILARGDRLAATHWGDDWQHRLRSRLRWVLVLAALLIMLAGASAAALALGDGRQPVNVVWLCGALLGLPTLLLLLWLLSLLWKPTRRGSGALLPRRLTAWAARWAGLPQAEQWLAASHGLLRGSGLMRWGFAVISHLLWLSWFVGALAGMAWMLSVRRYDFIWETTLLPDDWLPQLIDWLSVWPSVLGFAAPSAEQIASSAVRPADGAEVAQRWAAWSIAMLTAYGMLPRLCALLISVVLLRFVQSRVTLDLSLPYYLTLSERLSPSMQRLKPEQIVPPELPAFRVATPEQQARAASQDAQVICVECDLPQDWPGKGKASSQRVESREERRAALQRLQAAPTSRLLLVFDPRLSPDRSSLGLLSELSQHAVQLRVGLLADSTEERLAAWQDELAAMGIPAEHCLVDSQQAWRWVNGGSE